MAGYANRLEIVVELTNQENRMKLLEKIREALADRRATVGYGDRGEIFVNLPEQSVTVLPTDSLSDIKAKLQNPFERPKMSTIGEQLKAARAKLAEAREGAANAVMQSADVSRVVKAEVDKVLKEAAELQAEVAELTNGGPV